MAIRKNKKFVDPRYFMDEKTDIIKEEVKVNETDWHNITAGETAPPHSTAEPQELVQRIESAYHDLQDAFEELPDEMAQEMGRDIITRLETLMDTTEYPEDYRE